MLYTHVLDSTNCGMFYPMNIQWFRCPLFYITTDFTFQFVSSLHWLEDGLELNYLLNSVSCCGLNFKVGLL
jgi:hypothetical protein